MHPSLFEIDDLSGETEQPLSDMVVLSNGRLSFLQVDCGALNWFEIGPPETAGRKFLKLA